MIISINFDKQGAYQVTSQSPSFQLWVRQSLTRNICLRRCTGSIRCSTFWTETQARESMRSLLGQCFASRMSNTIHSLVGIVASCLGQPEQQGVCHLPSSQSWCWYDVGDDPFEGSSFHMYNQTFVLELIHSDMILILGDVWHPLEEWTHFRRRHICLDAGYAPGIFECEIWIVCLRHVCYSVDIWKDWASELDSCAFPVIPGRFHLEASWNLYRSCRGDHNQSVEPKMMSWDSNLIELVMWNLELPCY